MDIEKTISINELASLWGEKSYSGIIKMIQRTKIKDVCWYSKQEAIEKGLQWKDGGGGGKKGKRPFINIDDCAIPTEVKAKYFETHLNNNAIHKTHRKTPEAISGDRGPSFRDQGQEKSNMPASLAPASYGSEQNNRISAADKALVKRASTEPVGTHVFSPFTQGQKMKLSFPAPPFLSNVPEEGHKIARARLAIVREWKRYREAHIKKTEADKEFIIGYNNRADWKNLYEVLGEISKTTLYRWNQMLGGTEDYRWLIPFHYMKETENVRLTKEEAAIFMKILLNPNKVTIGAAIRLTKYRFEKKGIPFEKSPMTFRRYAEDFKQKRYDVWVFMREGQKALRDKVEPCIKRDASLLNVGDVLVADGHRLNFQVINPFTGKPCRAVLVGYLDWKSYDLAGYEIMLEENIQCIASALRNAIIRLGKLPKITYQDNGKAFKARFFTQSVDFEEADIYGLFARLGIIPMYANPYNARAKIIEGWFKNFSETFERLHPSFVGTSIQDQPAYMKRNEKFHKALHKEYIPTIEEVVQMIETWLEFHRSQACPYDKRKKIGEVFNEGRGEGIDVNELDYLMLDEKKTKIGRNGIRFLKSDYYDDNLYGLRESVIIKFSLFDLSCVRVYTLKGEFICIAKRVMPTHPVANYLGNAKDMENLKRETAQQKRLRKQTMKLAREYARQGKILEIDWQSAIDRDPKIINQIEEEGISLPGDTRQIPEEMTSGQTQGHSDVDVQNEQNYFDESWQRYEYLMKQTETDKEDQEWLRWYMSTSEYELLYGRSLKNKAAGDS